MFDRSPESKKDQKLKEEKKINRRQFLKDLGIVTTGVGLAAVGGARLVQEIGRFNDEQQKLRRENETQGEALVIKKEYTPMSNQVLPTGRSFTVIPQLEEWTIIFKIGDKKSQLNVSKQEYEKYNEGDKIQVIYDRTNMRVHKIANPDDPRKENR